MCRWAVFFLESPSSATPAKQPWSSRSYKQGSTYIRTIRLWYRPKLSGTSTFHINLLLPLRTYNLCVIHPWYRRLPTPPLRLRLLAFYPGATCPSSLSAALTLQYKYTRYFLGLYRLWRSISPAYSSFSHPCRAIDTIHTHAHTSILFPPFHSFQGSWGLGCFNSTPT